MFLLIFGGWGNRYSHKDWVNSLACSRPSVSSFRWTQIAVNSHWHLCVSTVLLRKWPQPVRMMCENSLWIWFISEKQSSADDKISLFNLNLMAKKCDTRRPFWLYSGPLLLSAAGTRRGSFGQQGLNTTTPANTKNLDEHFSIATGIPVTCERERTDNPAASGSVAESPG